MSTKEERALMAEAGILTFGDKETSRCFLIINSAILIASTIIFVKAMWGFGI